MKIKTKKQKLIELKKDIKDHWVELYGDPNTIVEKFMFYVVEDILVTIIKKNL